MLACPIAGDLTRAMRLSPLALAPSFAGLTDHPATMAAKATTISHDLASHVARAGLIDIDATVVFQALFFIILMLVLPKLIFQPMLARLDQRTARTDGAKAAAKETRAKADQEAARYEHATAEDKRKALEERAKMRAGAELQAADTVQKARLAANARVEAGIAEQQRVFAVTRGELQNEANALAIQISDKIVRG